MSDTRIKAGQFFGVIGHGTDGYFLMTNADGSMSWAEGGASGPSVTSVDYPGDDTAADPAGGQTVVLTGTGFAASGMTVSIGGTTAPSVAHDSNTQLTITTPAKAAGDYDIVVTNTVTGSSGTFVNGISYNGIPTWTTAAGSLGTFESETTISTITLQATEPDGGTITFNITNGALPSGLSLTGANIDGTTTAESSTTLYSFTIEAIDDENQSTPRNFSITVNSAAITPSENFTINTYTGNGSTQSIEGKIGTAAQFNGSSSIITNTNQVIPNGASSISFWYNSSGATGVQYIIGSGVATASKGITVAYTGSTGIFSVIILKGVSALAANFSGTTSYSNTDWHNVSVTWDGTTTANAIKLYVNGSLEAEGTSDASSASIGDYTTFGIGGVNGGGFAEGKIDQVRIFDKALSSSEVTTLYGENNTSTTKSTTDIFDDGSAVALYEFEEGAKDTGGVSGYIGAGGIFNGSSSYIDLGGSAPFGDRDDVKSISGWVKANSTSNVWLYSVSGTADSVDWFYVAYRPASNAIFVYRRIDTSNKALTSATITPDNNWHHIVAQLTATKVEIYLDGTKLTTTNTNEGSGSNTSWISYGAYGGTIKSMIGKSRQNTPSYTDGYIDQMRFFNKALSLNEVTTLYEETSASATKSTTDIFDDGSGVALYELEGNANDTGKGAIDSGQSAVFDGSSSKIQLPSGVSVATGNNDFTLSTWVYLDTMPSNFASVITTQDNYYFYILIASDGSVRTYNQTVQVDSSSGVITTGQWYNIVATLDSTSGKNVYVNGTNVATSTNTSNCNSYPTGHNAVGYYSNNGSNFQYYLDGKIDQVRIYDTALSSGDVTNLYNESSVPTANLVAHYKLDGNANDETTNYNGTATSITYSDPAEYPTYDGTATNVSYAYDGTPTNVSFVGTSFEPDLVWIKNRNTTQSHRLYDSVRGANLQISSNQTGAENNSGGLTSFDSNGFSLNSWASVNTNNYTYVAWCWKAGGTAVSNTDGSITSSVSANPDAGFSIVSYTGSATANQTVGHGLSQTPELIIVKNRDTTGNSWAVQSSAMGGADWHMILNSTQARQNNVDWIWNDTEPTSTVFTVGQYGLTNQSPDRFIAYCFHSIDGYQKVGSYTGSGTSLNRISVGFAPRFVLFKRTDSTGGWRMFDSTRGTDKSIRANSSDAEYDDPQNYVDFTSDGFEFNRTVTQENGDLNAPSGTYIYLAIA